MEMAPPKIASSERRLGHAATAALAGVCLGWFLLDTLVINVGPIRYPLKFFEMSAAIADPARVLLGLDSGHMLNSIAFGLVCAAVLLIPVLTARLPAREWSLTWSAPLLLMLLTGLQLYARTPGDFVTEPRQDRAIVHDLARLANDLLNGGAAAVTRVSVGAGAWLALAASLWLAWQGYREARR